MKQTYFKETNFRLKVFGKVNKKSCREISISTKDRFAFLCVFKQNNPKL